MKLDLFAEALLDAEVISFTDRDIVLSHNNNLLLNMMGGLLPEHLSKSEVDLLIDRFGENWFEDLGYDEPDYKKPNW